MAGRRRGELYENPAYLMSYDTKVSRILLEGFSGGQQDSRYVIDRNCYPPLSVSFRTCPLECVFAVPCGCEHVVVRFDGQARFLSVLVRSFDDRLVVAAQETIKLLFLTKD